MNISKRIKSIVPFEESMFSEGGQHIKKLYSKTNILFYLAILSIATLTVFISFTKVNIVVSSRGLIKSNLEETKITSTSSGIILASYIQENNNVDRGDTLIVIDFSFYDKQLTLTNNRILRIDSLLSDLNFLLGAPNKKHALKSQLLEIESLKYRNQRESLSQNLKQALINFERNKTLHDNQVISDLVFEEFLFKKIEAENSIKLFESTQLSEWSNSFSSLNEEKNNLLGRLNELRIKKSHCFIVSPLSGIVKNFEGIYTGSFVNENQIICRVTPTSNLLAEIYVSPRDIGLIEEGMAINLKVDAYNYNQWGILEGKVDQIFDDTKRINNSHFYVIKCSTNDNFLELSNGRKGYLKKGMTVEARFLITSRTIIELITDDINDWLNPTI